MNKIGSLRYVLCADRAEASYKLFIANGESGFTANEEMIVENISEGSLEARRMFFSGVMRKVFLMLM